MIKPLAFLLLAATAATADTILLLKPGGALTGLPGETVGWGFTITNTNDYLVVVATQFCTGVYGAACENPVGTYTDFSPYFLAGPGSETFSQEFDYEAGAGLGSFRINSGTIPGDFVAGTLFVQYDLYGDPYDGASLIAPPDGEPRLLSAPASVGVASGGPATVPEPSSVVLLAACLLAAALAARRHHEA